MYSAMSFFSNYLNIFRNSGSNEIYVEYASKKSFGEVRLQNWSFSPKYSKAHCLIFRVNTTLYEFYLFFKQKKKKKP